MTPFIKKKIEEFRETFKHSQFINYSKLESFLLQTIQDTLDEVEKRLPGEIEIEVREPEDLRYNDAIRDTKQVIKTIRDEQTN